MAVMIFYKLNYIDVISKLKLFVLFLKIILAIIEIVVEYDWNYKSSAAS